MPVVGGSHLPLACLGGAGEREGSHRVIVAPRGSGGGQFARRGAARRGTCEPGAHFKVSLVVRGRTGQWGADAVEAARMVLDDGAQGLIAPPNGAATHLALQVAGRTAVPVISLCADSSVSQTGVPWMVRIAPTTIEEARFLLAGLKPDQSDPPEWVALVPDGRAGREVSRDLNRAASAAQRKLKRVCEVSSTLTNLESVTAQVLKEQPKGVLVWLDPVPAGRLTRSLREAGFAGKLAGTKSL